MKRLYLVALFISSVVLWVFWRLQQLLDDTGRENSGYLQPRKAIQQQLPLDSVGFSFRRYTRGIFAAFVAEAALGDFILQSFFYGPRPELDFSSVTAMRRQLSKGFWFRLPGCDKEDLDPSPPSLSEKEARMGQAAKAAKEANAALEELCIFSQMRPSKNLAIVALARRLNITYIVESGRKGGASALVYSLLGLKVTSVELYPIPFVSRALATLAPDIQLRDGDGTELVVQAVTEIRRKDPDAHVAVVLDGPKYEGAYKVFQAIRDNVVFAVFDDTYPQSTFRTTLEAAELAVFFSDDSVWMGSGIPDRDTMKLDEGWPGDQQEPASQYAESWQALAVVPGRLWTQWQ